MSKAKEFLAKTKGKKITDVFYCDESKFPIICLDDGSQIIIQSDDEGNSGGVPIFVDDKGNEVGMWQI